MALITFTVLYSYHQYLSIELFHHLKVELLYPSNVNSPPSPNNQYSTFCYKLDYSRHLTKVESCNISSAVPGVFHLAQCFQDSSM